MLYGSPRGGWKHICEPIVNVLIIKEFMYMTFICISTVRILQMNEISLVKPVDFKFIAFHRERLSYYLRAHTRLKNNHPIRVHETLERVQVKMIVRRSILASLACCRKLRIPYT